MAKRLRDLTQKLPVRLQGVALLAQTLVDHGVRGLDCAPDRGSLIVLHRSDPVVLVEVSSDEVVATRVEKLAVPLLPSERVEELVVLEDMSAGQPGTACQTPGPLVGNKVGSAATTATEEELRTYNEESVRAHLLMPRWAARAEHVDTYQQPPRG